MPLPTSGPISLQNVASEFGGSQPHSLDEYYASLSGPVLQLTRGINGPIPSSGQISLQDFYGAPVDQTLNFVMRSVEYGSDSTIYPYPATRYGWMSRYPNGMAAFGSIQSGKVSSAEGWGLVGLTFLHTNVAINYRGFHLWFYPWLSNRRFEGTVTTSLRSYYFDTQAADDSGPYSLYPGPVTAQYFWWNFGQIIGSEVSGWNNKDVTVSIRRYR